MYQTILEKFDYIQLEFMATTGGSPQKVNLFQRPFSTLSLFRFLHHLSQLNPALDSNAKFIYCDDILSNKDVPKSSQIE